MKQLEAATMMIITIIIITTIITTTIRGAEKEGGREGWREGETRRDTVVGGRKKVVGVGVVDSFMHQRRVQKVQA